MVGSWLKEFGCCPGRSGELRKAFEWGRVLADGGGAGGVHATPWERDRGWHPGDH